MKIMTLRLVLAFNLLLVLPAFLHAIPVNSPDTTGKPDHSFKKSMQCLRYASSKMIARDTIGALALVNQSLEYFPDNPAAFEIRGFIKSLLSDFSGAEADLTRFIEADLQSYPKKFYKGISKKKFQEFVLSEMPRAYYYRGMTRLEQQDTSGALMDLQQSILLSPRLIYPYLDRAKIYTGQNKDDLALEDYDQVIKIDMGYTSAYYSRGYVKLTLLDYNGAISDFNIVIEREPSHNRGYLGRGDVKVKLKDYEGAMRDYRQAQTNNPGDKKTMRAIGHLLSVQRRDTEAIEVYQQVLAVEPDSYWAYDNLGYCNMSLGNEAKALEYFDKCLELKTDNVDALIGKSILFYRSGDMKKAKETFELAQKINPLLLQGEDGLDKFKKQGWFYSPKDEATILKLMEL